MAWSLEIHHLDIGQGDSTLIIAEDDGVGVGAVAQVRAALVDGGTLGKGDDVHDYITNDANLNQVDVIVATHYDADHFGGLRRILSLATPEYDNALIFDQGEPGQLSVKRSRGPGGYVQNIIGRERDYNDYLTAIASRGARTRVTANVSVSTTNLLMQGAGWEDPDWLLGQELLWHGAAPPVGAPTITCIAVNQYVHGAGGPFQSGMAVDPKNEKSIALLVRFNNFRYYMGGDIESTQETQIAQQLNPANNANGRVLAMKVSHHGSDRSTLGTFVNRLRPSAAFISCGYNNTHHHPRPAVLQNLQNCGQLQNYYLTADRNDQKFRTRVGRNTLPAVAPNMAAAYTAKAVVAGCWGGLYDAGAGVEEGHIVLSVTAAQSLQPVTGVLPMGTHRFSVACARANVNAYQNAPIHHD
ncbi:ComEC/Rec2 family competence protein [Hyalangium rubrum]|uniref:MBL fold metallo-hydrolase n=1 Tax=Hyalangium rubrum TaxID=3103134 RepID=A0ABU5H7B8_9BACT|nr:MBL fold metallo-hydrolase [Hyalangium sp. s54d21]MDY7229367.1 MBL fold metallo-hydrolase [Hyalangium sp. s54d21]